MVGCGVGQIGRDYSTGLRLDDARYPERYNMRGPGVGGAAALLNCLCHQRSIFFFFYFFLWVLSEWNTHRLSLGSTRKIVRRGYRCSLNRKIPLSIGVGAPE